MTEARRDFQRIAIVNRGEPAMRLINAVRELNREHGDHLCCIALFTEPDRRAMFVREADEAVDLGAATVVDPRDGGRMSSYLDYARLERGLVEAHAEAAWVGWGFVAEHAAFADLCRRLGIVFIGPEADVMRRLGDKIAAKHVAERIGVPVVAWSDNPVDSVDDARIWAGRLGYPLMIKASAGGGGRGMRLVHSEAELGDSFERARAEAGHAFGDATVFLERAIAGVRHVEVQIIADHFGTIWPLGIRDCTIQRRHQKVLEESPSPALSPALQEALQRDAMRLCESAGYQNAGTVEFLFDPAAQRYYFMEVNPRLQVEHPVTELVTGVDLVKLQLHVARGGRLEGHAPRPLGHAVEVRLNAEDPDNAFAPAPGVVELLRLPTGPGIRVDTGIAEGDVVPAEFDSMLVKVVAYGRDRGEALARLRRALGQSLVVVRGGATNKGFLLDLLGRQEVQRGELDTAWLDGLVARGEHLTRRDADLALLQAAVAVYDTELHLERTQFCTSATRGRPRVRADAGRTVELRYRGNLYRIEVACRGPDRYRLVVDGHAIEIAIERLNGFESWLRCRGSRHRILSVTQGLHQLVDVDGASHRISRDDGGLVRAPAPAVVLAIPVQPGDAVAAGERLVVLEAMKMELPVVAPFAGRVRRVLVTRNVQVDTGASLVLLDPVDEVAAGASGDRVPFNRLFEAASADDTAPARGLRGLDALRRLTLGFDGSRGEGEALIAAYRTDHAALAGDDASVRRAEEDLLDTYADLCALFRRPAAAEEVDGEGTLGTQEYLIAYLRGADGRGEGLPATFLGRLRRALAHYGIASLDRTPALEEGLLRIYKAHQHGDAQAAPVLAVLERRLPVAAAAPAPAEESFRALLDRLIAAAEGRIPAVSELARAVRYRCFDGPLFEAARQRVYDEAQAHLAALARQPDAPERADWMRALIECPQPLVSLIIGRLPHAATAMREVMLEVLTRRYYRIRQLTLVHLQAVDGQSCALAEYALDGRPIRSIATFGTYDRLAEVVTAVGEIARTVPADCDIVADLYVASAQPLGDADATQRALEAVLNRAQFPRPLRRVVIVLSGPDAGWGMSGVQHFTYRPGPAGYAEEKLYRGLHPMMGKRLDIWRLANFAIERLPSVEDVYLFRAVARENPNDERLFALAEVRDLTPVRDQTGRIVALPYLERMLMEALAAIRRVRFQRPADRPDWNRVLLYVWPTLSLSADELNDLMRKLAPATAGLGLEQVAMRARMPDPHTGMLRDTVLQFTSSAASGLIVTSSPPPSAPLRPLGEYDHKVLRMRQRGLVYPYEIIKMLAPASGGMAGEFPPGEFAEYDLDDRQCLVEVQRPYGKNAANVVVGVIRNVTRAHPEGLTRVILFGDPSRSMGAVAEPECRRIIAALDLAERLGVPLEWFAVSAGAKISMESGTENMDWIASVLRRLIEFTQAGHEVNVVVNGINVGAQPYWNAEATMLLHTRGILVMTPQGAMVLTGKQALDYSGSVSAEDNQGIGGYERIMGPNGQAQYFARDLAEACRILLHHYALTYLLPGERFPRRKPTADPSDRDVRAYPHGVAGDEGFHTIGEVFSDEKNAGRKRAFDIRTVMHAVIDQDLPPLERWTAMRNAEIAVIWDAHLGGYPACLIGIESKPLPRFGFLPADGPDHWTAGTLFPMASKKIARAVTAASGNRPLVILANLSGFDGSPESMRELQLEYGAEIGRAVVNFRGPIVFCVISRYHGGAYVVFSTKLNEGIEAAALEGSYASVIGGAPAAAVVFAGEVEARTKKDARIADVEQRLGQADGAEKSRLRVALAELRKEVHSEKLGEVADEFDRIHNIYRARDTGSLHHVIPAARLRPYLIEALERGMARAQARQ